MKPSEFSSTDLETNSTMDCMAGEVGAQYAMFSAASFFAASLKGMILSRDSAGSCCVYFSASSSYSARVRSNMAKRSASEISPSALVSTPSKRRSYRMGGLSGVSTSALRICSALR